MTHTPLPNTRVPNTPVRIMLVDDDPLMRAGLRTVISSDPAIEVVGEASDGRAAISSVDALAPDVVLMDVRMPDLDGIATTRQMLAPPPRVRVVILTTFEDDDYIFGAIHAGASGFLLKRTRPEELLSSDPHRRRRRLAPVPLCHPNRPRARRPAAHRPRPARTNCSPS